MRYCRDIRARRRLFMNDLLGRDPTEHDYPEDWPGENGMYQQTCCECGKQFVGHKRRMVCKKCMSPHEPVRRFGVVTTWNDDCTKVIGSHIEERPDGIYRLASDYERVETDKANAARIDREHRDRLQATIDRLVDERVTIKAEKERLGKELNRVAPFLALHGVEGYRQEDGTDVQTLLENAEPAEERR